MASVDLIRISVAREFGTWQTRFGEVVRDFDSEGAAVVAAISQAQDLGRQGRFAAVVMRTLTSVYGPTGLIRTLPTRGRPNGQMQDPMAAEAEDIAFLAEPAPSVVPTALETADENPAPVRLAVRKPAAMKPATLDPVASAPAPSKFAPAKRDALGPSTAKPAALKTLSVEERRLEADRQSGKADAISTPAEAEPERPGRFMRIVAALTREAEERAPAGRSIHQTITRLARSRRVPSLR
jgi:hypothetical protein